MNYKPRLMPLIVVDKPVGKGHFPYEPHLAIGSHSIAKEDKIKLAFIGHVIGKGHRHPPNTGVIINVAGDAQRIQLAKLMAYLEPAIDTLKAWKGDPATAPPPILLNDHCPICPFKKKCLEQAEKDDSLTLLDRMTPKVMRKYHKKGIFTITQLSYLFKPRRQRKKRKDRPAGFNLELQALALRTGKIYLHQSPTIPQHSTELFLDMEGVPDHGSHYLIGLVIRSEGQAESHSLWADSSHEEKRILEEFVALANRHPDAPIYHYGSYEPKALVRMAKASGVDVDAIIGRLVNVNTFIFGKVYFPARSNTLKELGRFFGATWSSPDASGLQSVVWRMQWQASIEGLLKFLRFKLIQFGNWEAVAAAAGCRLLQHKPTLVVLGDRFSADLLERVAEVRQVAIPSLAFLLEAIGDLLSGGRHEKGFADVRLEHHAHRPLTGGLVRWIDAGEQRLGKPLRTTSLARSAVRLGLLPAWNARILRASRIGSAAALVAE